LVRSRRREEKKIAKRDEEANFREIIPLRGETEGFGPL
jgi:hypothetical protein